MLASSLQTTNKGFTLIELSIVLVIIGLIVGGVLTGQDLIRAAEVRATISQVEKYNTAVNTFLGKYGALPGDLNAATATQFGFSPRGTLTGEGDGNGLLQGASFGPGSSYTMSYGELPMFWVDLTTANGLNVNLVEGGFGLANETTPLAACGESQYGRTLPPAKLGRGNYFYVYSYNGVNYFGLSDLNLCFQGSPPPAPYAKLSVAQAYNIDKKMDDGFPKTGSVLVQYVQDATGFGFDNGQASDSATSCYNTVTQKYSLSYNSGNGANCGLSFRFQ